MSALAIRVEHLSKCYRITRARTGSRVGRYRTLQDDVRRLPARLWAAVRRRDAARREAFLALDDVSFELGEGDVLGVIGRNGAGKSTLLKLLSRITAPSGGWAEMYGRVGSLLEVGTGFHPELTGRENVFLNGAILGMRRSEIAAKFDEIVAFAENERFIDTPVKYYSSGMYVRLAFAVAAHLEPEILVVDEVLAVGDLEFQAKCLRKVGDIAHQGRTVLFVSHNMAAITSLCNRGLLLEKGRVAYLGDARTAVDRYTHQAVADSDTAREPGVWTCPPEHDDRELVITRVEMLDPATGDRKGTLATHDAVTFRLHYRAQSEFPAASLYLLFRTRHGVTVAGSATNYEQIAMSFRAGEAYADCTFTEWLLTAGEFLIEVAIADAAGGLHYHVEEFGVLTVVGSLRMESRLYTTNACMVYLPHHWTTGRPH